MPAKRGRRGARKRETQLPPPMAFVNDRRRRRSPPRQLLVEEPSVIMLSSAENTLMPEGGLQDESSVVIRRSGRRSTRLTDVDMMLDDETGISMLSRESKSMTSDGTNMSIVNVDQTMMTERERAISSVLPRWTRSTSIGAARVEENADGIRRSSMFSMVTKRNRRRGRSVVRNSTRENNSLSVRNTDVGQGMDLSQISEEQSNTSASGSVAATPKQFVKEFVIQTRSMLKKGKRWSPDQMGSRSAGKAQASKNGDKDKQAASRNKRGRKRKQTEVNVELPVQESGKEVETNEITLLVPSVTRRKRKELNFDDKTPAVDANQNLSFPSENEAPIVQPIISQEPAEEGEKIVNPATSNLETSSDRSNDDPCNISKFSNVSKRKRLKPIPDKELDPPNASTAAEKNKLDTSASEPEPVSKRARTRSVSRARQPEISTEKRRRGRNRSVSRSRQVALEKINATTQEVDKSIPPRGRGRPRTRAISESAKIGPIEHTIIRNRSKSALRKPKTGTPSRSKSVPRTVLSPSSANHSTDHVPVYRRHADHVLQLNQSVQHLPDPNPNPPAPSGEDVYMFDSPSPESTVKKTDVDDTKKPKGSTAKKRPRLTTTVSSRNRKTPVKNHTTVFGTDMGKISSVVKKIGGGPVRQKTQEEGSSASKNVVHTSTLAAMVHPLQPSNALNIVPRSPLPAVQTREVAVEEDHHYDQEDEGHHDFDEENIPQLDLPTPLSPPRLNPQIQRVLQQSAPPPINTPDKAQPHSTTLNFSPQASSSPWRIQNENVLPKTFYFSRSKDLLPSYESDLVVRDEHHHPAVTPQDILPEATETLNPRRTSPTRHQHSFVRPTAVPPTTVSSAVFKDIQKSYEQLKATSEMSEKLISAMRKYKSNVHNQTNAASLGDETSAEELIAKFRKYEENMKHTYQKLQQWYKRSQRTLSESMKTIEQTSSVPKTPAQKAVVENFCRNSERFVSMINELESALNDSNIENISPPKPLESSGRPPFKDIILTERNRNDRNRSPLKMLDITNAPPRFSPIKSPLVKASFTSFTGNRTMLQSKSRDRFSKLSLAKRDTISSEAESFTAVLPAATEKSVIEIVDTVLEAPNATSNAQPEQDLFGFEMDDEPEHESVAEIPPLLPTPAKITRETLKERLQSVRKLLPARIGSASKNATLQQHPSRIFNSPHRKRMQSIQNAFSASTPLAEGRGKQPKPRGDQDPNISAIRPPTELEKEAASAAEKQDSPPAAVFDEPEQLFASNSLASVNRTYSRVPRRNFRRKPNIYLANLGISDNEEEDEEEEAEASDSSDWTESGKRRRRKQTKKQAPKQKKKTKTVEQSAEFKNFVSEFNSMCDQVNRYELVVDKPAIQQPV